MQFELDKDGYLCNLSDWNTDVAEYLASTVNIKMTPEHWEVITLLRQFYTDTGISPAMRILVKMVKKALGPDKGNSIYLLTLFPDSPAKLAAKIAGLPRPTNCL
ncbi:MAG: sulfurtransferase TusE [Oceanospirillaceae bacterium]|nr:sulfurtransferase TusE [Oceanospirillaceae bacterium]